MSWKPGQKAGRKRKSSWTGESVSQEAPRHRWQDSTSTDVNRSQRRSRNRWAVFTLIALVLLAILIWMFWPRPYTPLVVVTAIKYEVPVPINAWAMEDRHALEELNGKNLAFVSNQSPEKGATDSHFKLLPESFDPQ